MKIQRQIRRSQKAFTLLEMTVVILVLLTLAGIGTISTKKINEWKLAREAGETLRLVYTAQRQLLSDQPTKRVSEITSSDLLPYMKTATAIPTVEILDGSEATIDFTVSPPVIGSAATPYDPSGSDSDSLWDVGQ